MSITTINPFTEEEIAHYPFDSRNEIEEKIARASIFYHKWKREPISAKANYLLVIADLLEKRKAELAYMMMIEMGKPLAQGSAEIEKCIWVCQYYAETAASMLAPELQSQEKRQAAIHFNPLGIVLSIMPWNYPFWQVFRFFAPAMMVGNVTLLKHAPNVTGCALLLEKLIRDVDASNGLLQVILANNETTSELISHSDIRAVTLTGSVQAGRAVGAQAGASLKKCVLELGGSDPYIILPDADLEDAAKKCAQSRLINSGQSCIAAKRFIVVKGTEDGFLERLLNIFGSYTSGDPANEITQLGPLARQDLKEQLVGQVQKSVKKGAVFHVAGTIPDKGFFHPVGILTGIDPGQPAYSDELFGPVASLLIARDEQDAIRIANDTTFGLGAGIFTKDLEKAKYLAVHELNAGSVFVNDFVKSDPRLPFGGIRDSGIGRELGSYGIKEFVNIKTITYD